MAEEHFHSAVLVEVKKGKRCVTAWDETFVSLAGLPENRKDISADDINSDALRKAVNGAFDSNNATFILNGNRFSVESHKMGKEKFLLTFYKNGELAESDKWQNELDILKLLSEKTNDGLWLMDKNFKTVYMSPAIELHMGFTPEEYVAMPITERLPAEAIKIFQEKYQQLLIEFKKDPKNDSIIFELPHKHKNGSVKWGEVSVRIIQGENHSIEGFAGVTRNVDEKHRLQEKLNESEMIFRELTENIPAGVMIFKENEFVYLNPATEQITGFPRDEMMKLRFWDMISQEQQEFVKQRGFKRLQGEKIENGSEFKVKTKDGKERWVIYSGTLTQYKGEPAVIGSVIDITPLKEVENEIKNSEEKFRSLFELAADGIAIFNEEGIVVDINSKVEDIFRISREHIVGKKIVNFLGIEQLAARPVRFELMNKGETIIDERLIVTPEGHKRLVEIRAKRIREGFYHAFIRDITEKKESEIKLYESEMLFRELTEYTPAAIFIYQGTSLVYVNPGTERITGYTRDELLKMNFWDLVAPEHKEMVKQRGLQRQQGENIENRYEFMIVTKTGQKKWIDFSGSMIQHKGAPAAIGSAFDISRIKDVELKIRESEEKYRNLFELAADGIAVFDENGILIDINTRVEEIFNYRKEDVIGKKISDFLAAGQAESKPLRFDLLNDNQTVVNERSYVNSEGKELIIETHAKKMPGNTYQVFIRDITERRNMEKDLAKSEEQFRQMSENIADGITIIENKKVVFVNKRLSQITGYSEEELRNMASMDIAAPWEKQRVIDIYNKVKDRKEDIFSLEYCITTKSGEERYILNRYSYSPTNPNRKYLITTDITDRIHFEKELMLKNEEIQLQNKEYRELNKELQRSIEKARESDKLKSAFIANMSHEIRTPLNAIMGFSEMLTKKELSREKINKYSTVINNSGKHLLSLVTDIIDISKIETGQMDVSFDAINLNHLFNETSSFFEQMAREKTLVFKLDIPAEEFNIISDRTKLQQILNNLISNSIKFTEFGEVRFGFRVKDGLLNIYVSDTGIGILKKNIPAIFERFRQLENNQGKKYQGTGLGLAIVKGLTELLKGNIEVESELNRGTKFRLTFPVELAEDNSENTENIICEPSGCSFEGYKILIAEDETISRLLFAEILQPTGIEIIEAADGKEAYDAYKSSNPDIVILDLGLPKMDGIQVCREIRKINNDTPVIACSAYAYSTDKEKAFKAGCNDFITKPYQSEQLLGIISGYLQRGSS